MIHVKVFTFNPVQENTYVLHTEQGKAIIIDPGCYFTAEEETLNNFIKDTKLTPVQLLNTHCHLDHVFGNKWVYDHFGLELFLHTREEPVLERAAASGERWGLPFLKYSGPRPFLAGGDEETQGNDRLRHVEAPGHSPGSICFYCEAQHFLIGGDVLFRESIGRTDLPGGDHQTLLNSIQQQLFSLPDDVTVYPGHGPATTISHEKKHNPFLTLPS
ncbi:MAG: MBL fold metallo-hydrolase [Sediminibacterium sp.]